jgi:hypothetical protein
MDDREERDIYGDDWDVMEKYPNAYKVWLRYHYGF